MARAPWTDQRMEIFLANLLRAGVMLAASLVLAGGALFLARQGGERLDLHLFRGEPPEFRSVRGVLRGVVELRGRALIQFGLLVLIATPIARVLFAAFGFWRQRDRVYVVVALIVLSVLTYSMMAGSL